MIAKWAITADSRPHFPLKRPGSIGGVIGIIVILGAVIGPREIYPAAVGPLRRFLSELWFCSGK